MVKPLRRKLLRDTRRHRAQFVAIAITMFLGVTIFGASYDSFRNLRASYDEVATRYRFANLTLAGGDTEAIALAVDRAGVEAVEVRTVAEVPIQVGDIKLLGRAVGVPTDGQPAVNQLEILTGATLSGTDGALVESHMAHHFGLAPGDTLRVLRTDGGWQTLTVRGTVASPEYIWPSRDRQELLTSPDNFGVVYVAPELAGALTTGPNEVAVYYAGGGPDAALSDELTEIAHSLGATSVYTRAEQASNAALSEDLAGFEEMAVFFPMLFLGAAGMAVYVMTSRLVHTQRPHIGVMLANGFSRRQVLGHYLGYGLLPGLAGSIPGAIVGIALARVITDLYTGLLSIPLTIVEFRPATLVAAVAFGVTASVLATLAPSMVASRVQPAQAMRGETPTGGGRRSLLERAIPPLRRLPVPWRMALRDIGRNPRRTAYTIIGVTLSLMLVLVSWGMIDTIQFLLDRQFVEIQQEDATVYFAQPVTSGDISNLTSIEGVARAEAALTLPVSLSKVDATYDTALTVLADGTEMRRFPSSEGEWIPLPADGIVLGEAARDLLGIEVGDPVTVTVAGLGSVEERVAAFVDEPLGTIAYVARSRAESTTGVSLPVTAALVSYAADTDPASVRESLTALPHVAAFEDANAIYDVVQDYMVLFYAFVGVMLVFGAAMAFALIFNAMSVNIAERTREVATLLAVGTDRRSINRLITAENLLVAAIGVPIGLVVGYLAARQAMASFSSDLFAFDLRVAAATFVWAALAMLGVALLSQWPGLRALRRLSIPAVIKERAA